MKWYLGKCLMLVVFFLSGINSMSAQSLYREYSDENVYMYINNSTRQYWTSGPKLPHHELVIKNVGSENVYARVLIRVVLRNGQGNYLDETTQERNVDVAPGGSKTETIWMSTAGKKNAYYCVEGFRVLKITVGSDNQSKSNSHSGTRDSGSQTSDENAYTIKHFAEAYYYNSVFKRFIRSEYVWEVGKTVYLTGQSYDVFGITLMETTAVDEVHNSYWYIPDYAF